MRGQEVFEETGNGIEWAVKGNLFGKPCYKIKGKAFVCLFQGELVFKLKGNEHTEALSLDGAQLFDPSGKGRPMKDWVQLPVEHRHHYEKFARAAAINASL